MSPDVCVLSRALYRWIIGFDQLPIVGASNKPIGLVTLGNLMSLVSSGRLKLADAVRAQIRQ